MGSVHNDLHSWAAKARGQHLDTIEIDLDTADRAAQKIVDLSNQVSELEHQARRREADLLEANNRYLQRARDAEQKIANLQGVVEALEDAAYAAHGRGYVQGFADSRWDESGDYNEDALTADLDREKMRDGWYDDALHTYRDAQTKAVASVKAAP